MRQIYFLGKFRIIDPSGKPIKLATRKIENLLAFLWLRRERPQARERIAGLFWPESSSKKARASLRTALYNITKSLDLDEFHQESSLLLTRNTAQFNPDLPFWVDVSEFESNLEIDELAMDRKTSRSFQNAVALYVGEFLEGCYDDWCLEERDYLREQYLNALHQLVTYLAEQKDYERAISFGKEILSNSPLQEEIHQKMMVLYHASGDRNGAFQQYYECVEILENELGVEPLAETQALFQEIEALSSTAHLDEIAKKAREFPKKYPELGSPFAGRIQECSELTQAWDSVMQGSGKTILIKGMAGMGKTRLGQVIAEYVRSHGGVALRGRCHALEGSLPYQPWIEILRQALESCTAATLGRISSTWLSELMNLIPELTERFPELTPSATLHDPEQDRNRLFEGVTQALLVISQERPIFILLDDLQWADESTLQFSHYFARRIINESILMLGLHRSEELGENQSLTHFIQLSTKESMIKNLELKPLDEGAMEEMIRGILNIHLESPKELNDQIFRSAMGNPFFIVELIRSYIDSGALHSDSRLNWQVDHERLVSTAPPDTVKALVDTRLRQVGHWCRELLNLVSTRSHYSDIFFLIEALKRSEDDLISDLETLLQLNFLVPDNGGYVFQHDLIREVIYDGLLPERQRRLHLRAALALESLYQDEHRGYGEQSYAELAHQFFEARKESKAIDYSLLAAELAWSKNYAKEEALHYFHRAHKLSLELEDEQSMMRALKGLGEICCWTDSQDEGIPYCEKANSICRDPELGAEILLSLAHAYHVKRDLERGLSYCRKALETLSPDKNGITKVRVYADAASFMIWLRRYDESIENCTHALEILALQPNASLHARILSKLGHAYTSKGELKTAIKHFSAAANMAESSGDIYSIGIVYFNLAIAHDRERQIEDAIEAFLKSLRIIEQMGTRYDELGAIHNRLTYLNMQLGDINKSVSHAEKQLKNYELAGEEGNVGMSYGMLACLHDISGQQSQAELHFSQALDIAPKWSAMYYSIIVSYLYSKDMEKAIAWLVRGFPFLLDQHKNALLDGPPDLAETAEFEILRASNEFKDLFS